MGRNTYPLRGPRTNLVANREIKQALRGTQPAAFGIRRMLQRDSNDFVTDATFPLHTFEGGDVIPAKVELRDSLSVTLLSQKVIGRQLARGAILGFNLGKARALLERNKYCGARTKALVADIGDVRVHRGRIIYADLLSEQLEDEVFAIKDTLESLGLKAESRHDFHVPHMTLGETVNGQMLSADEQARVIEGVRLAMPVSVEIEPWDTYPYNLFDTQAVA